MSTQITIHGKRVETIYAFTVEYKGEKITGRLYKHKWEDGNTLDKFEFEPLPGTYNEYSNIKLQNKIKEAIKAYDKAHR